MAVTKPTAIERYGTPSRLTYPFMCEKDNGTEVIVYATDMIAAIQEYIRHYPFGPWQVRIMSDNE